jgi:hypothetical protein
MGHTPQRAEGEGGSDVSSDDDDEYDLLSVRAPQADAMERARAQAHHSFFHSPLDIHNNEVDYRRRGAAAVADATVAPLSQVARYPRATTDAKLESSRMQTFDANAYQRGDFL